MVDIAKLKKKSQQTFKKAVDQTKNTGGGYGDDRFWSPYFDQDNGTGRAVIRFLPPIESEDLPWIKVYSHGFKGPTGKWYIENCLSTIGKQDPCNELNSRLWNSGVDSDKDIARDQKRRMSFYANVLVLEDPANPQNEGKVFLYRFGKKIYDMIEEAMVPEFEGDEALDPFNPWEGADFEIRMRKVAGYRNYDKSAFRKPSELHDGDDDKIAETWEKCYSLQQFHEPAEFKDYAQLQKRLLEVLGPEVGSGIEVSPGTNEVTQNQQREEPAKKKSAEPSKSSDSDEDDDTPPFKTNDEVDLNSPVDGGNDQEMDDLDFFKSVGSQ